MSHVADVQLQVLDIEALKAAVEAIGGIWHEGKTTHRWYGRFVGDWNDQRAAANRRDPKTFGKCLHAVSFPGINYEVGVVPHTSGTGYDLVYDNFGSGGSHDGQLLERKLGGPDARAVKQHYAVNVTKRELSRKGYRVALVPQADGSIKVKATR